MMESFDANKKWVALILVGVIIIIGVILIVFHKTIFVQTIKLTFPDGCIEVYKNGVIVTPICTNGRMLEQQRTNPVIANNDISNIIS